MGGKKKIEKIFPKGKIFSGRGEKVFFNSLN